MERLMLLRLIHHLSGVQGVLLQGCKTKGGHVMEGGAAQKTSPHLSDQPTRAPRSPVCFTAGKSQDDSKGCWRSLAMGRRFSTCVSQSGTVHFNHLLGDFPMDAWGSSPRFVCLRIFVAVFL